MREPRHSARIAAVALAALLLAGCAAEPDAQPGPSGTASSSAPAGSASASPGTLGEPEVLVEGLDAPWSIAFHDDVALVSERDSARILEVSADGATSEVGTIADVAPNGEGGLLGIAVREGYLYAYFTAASDNRVARYELTGEAGSLGLGEPETLLDGIPAASYHNGGRIAFGPDGYLYVTAGDAGNTASAQDLDALSGKILRLTPEGEVPGDNPFAGSPVWSYGHRNPQGIAWDADGTMYASEFGQDTWDELNIIDAGSNYGWPTVEGAAGDGAFVDPVQEWSPADASPSGIAIAGEEIYLANLRGERLRVVPLADLGSSNELFVGEYGRLRDVVVAPDGALWVLTNNTDGRGDPAAGDDRILRIPFE